MRISLALLFSLCFSACSPRLVSLPDSTQIPPTVAIQATEVGTATAETDEIVSIAVADLSSRLSIDPEQMYLISAESRLWPDAALGCPRPGEVYAQEMVPGYQIRLEATGQVYEYHSDMNGTVTLCDLPLEDNSARNDIEGNIQDGWPNDTKDQEVIINITPTQKP